jgi:hypothetical protein
VGKAFRLQTDDGVQLVLSGDYADTLKNHPDLSLTALTADVFQAGIHGFDAFTQGTSDDHILHTMIKEGLTHHLRKRTVCEAWEYIADAIITTARLTTQLSNEAAVALEINWNDSTGSHSCVISFSISSVANIDIRMA